MPEQTPRRLYVFPRWANYLLPVLILGAVGGATYMPVVIGYGADATTLNVGYAPQQPVPFSHALHAGELGMDCRYCHTTVEQAAFAAIPPTETCMNCHAKIRAESDKLAPVRASHASGMPVEWVRVHDLGDYAFFNHRAHVMRGVGCVSCHGRLDKMEVVDRVLKETLRMRPSVPFLARRTIKECEISGHRIPADTMIWVSPLQQHHDPKFWTNPEQFDPDRFSPERAEFKNHSFCYHPFGGGAHKCIGMHFAAMLTKTFMHQLLLKYEYSLPADFKPRFEWVPLPKPAKLPIQWKRI